MICLYICFCFVVDNTYIKKHLTVFSFGLLNQIFNDYLFDFMAQSYWLLKLSFPLTENDISPHRNVAGKSVVLHSKLSKSYTGHFFWKPVLRIRWIVGLYLCSQLQVPF